MIKTQKKGNKSWFFFEKPTFNSMNSDTLFPAYLISWLGCSKPENEC